MDDTRRLDMNALLAKATSYFRNRTGRPDDKSLVREPGTDPATGKLESQWVNKPELPDVVTNGIL